MDMTKQQDEIAGLEKSFWKSIADGTPDVATGLLTEPALMVSGHGATRFDHATYRKMAREGQHRLLDYTISDMEVVFPRDDVAVATYHVDQTMDMQGTPTRMEVYDTSTWVKVDGRWRCVLHTESSSAGKSHQPPGIR